VPVVRRQVAERYGSGLADVLNAVSAKLTTAGVVELNRRVVLAGEPADRVAVDWLRSNGLG
jgi:osmoprotectant transport system substrate-binding protein